jgi:outer membrane protein insertion porin family
MVKLFVLWIAFQQVLVAAEEVSVQTIRKIRIEGNQKVAAGDILGKMHSRSGAEFDQKLVDEDLRRLIAMPEIVDVVCQSVDLESEVDLVITVKESQVIDALALSGNKNISEEKLLEELLFKTGDFIDPYLIRTGAEALAEFYRKKGYYSVQVKVDEEKLAKERQVHYRISEGPKCRITKVKYEGNRNIRGGKLKGQIKTRPYFPIFQKGLVNDDKLEQDRLSLASYYHAEGYLDAQVYRKVRFNKDRTRAEIDFVIEEGDQYRIVAMRFEGNTVFDNPSLIQSLTLTPAQVLTTERELLAVRAIKRKYGELGYVYCDVEVKKEYTDREGEIVVVFQINEGRPYQLGSFIVKGNATTRDKVVRRDFDHYGFTPGRLYNTGAADKGKRRLMSRTFFDRVEVRPVGNDPNSRDALVEVNEQLTGILTFGVGVGSDSGAFGTISIEERNFDISNWPSSFEDLSAGKSFRGGGQRLRFGFQPGTEETTGNISFSEPYLFDQPYYLNLDLFLFRRYQESYEERRRGGRVTLGRRFDNDWSADVGFRIELVKVGDLDLGKDKDGEIFVDAPQDVRDVKGDNQLTSVTAGLGHDTTDRFNRPTEGHKLRASWEQYGAMGGDFPFGAMGLEGVVYQTLYEDLLERRTVLASRVRYNKIFGDAPVFERYYVGGIRSLRGFDFRGVSRRDGPSRDPVGSDYMILMGTEVNQPLYEETLFGKVFVDTAIIDEGPARVAAGIGLEIMIPQLLGNVPMQFNVAVPINEDREDDNEFFSFSMGFRY